MAAKPPEVVLERLVVFVGLVVLLGAATTVARPDETGQVVDVAMGVVAGDAAPEPEHLVDAR